ncbi:30S ribosomal protein S27ae [Candidatus Woesearchaeota archaeon]|nr:30S ribosomal protein S27ae [Candidatus Woesearchaeota archaeon]
MPKKQRKPKKPLTLYKRYKKLGDGIERTNKFCPKCGKGFFLAQHNNRVSCGNCAYTEFQKK